MSATTLSGAGSSGRVIGLVSAGHCFSHLCVLVLPPLFPMIKAELDIGYTLLGSLIGVYALAGAVTQTPVGWLVDRIGGRAVLMAGLFVQAVALGAVGFADAYWQMAVLMAIAGIGNSVYHPADFAIFAARVEERLMGRAVGIHAFTGYLGWAIAPPIMFALVALTDWRGALVGIGLIGLTILAVLLAFHGALEGGGQEKKRGRAAAPDQRSGFAVLMSGQLIALFVFYFLTTVASTGLMSFATVALAKLQGTDVVTAGAGLTAFLIASALGVLVGGVIADRWTSHNRIAAATLCVMALSFLVCALSLFNIYVTIAILVVGGLAFGINTPSRDLLVRAVTPKGSIGIAFGFTSTGMMAGNGLGPIVCGWIMDLDRPDLMFGLLVVATLLAVATVLPLKSQARIAATAG
ncbi:MAG: MFS transporter [Alphaproteobacteria bacterium]|nr:MFS transporter [Alphaproteobacteria bacterium]